MAKQAVDAPRFQGFVVALDAVTIVGLDTDDGPEHQLFDERIKLPLDEGTIQSMMAHGILDPIECIKDGDRLLVDDGRQRVRNGREASARLVKQGKEPLTVRVLLTKGSMEDAALRGVMFNELRQADTTAVRVAKTKRLLAGGKTKKEVATAFGFTSTGPLDNLLAYDSLDSTVKTAVDAGQISWSAAAKLAPLARTEQVSALASLVAESGGKTISKEQVKTKVRTKTGTVDTTKAAPSKVLLRKLIEQATTDADDCPMDPAFVKAIRWVCGDLDTKAIAGLAAYVRTATSAADKDGE